MRLVEAFEAAKENALRMYDYQVGGQNGETYPSLGD
jgi:hypothetical protein